MISDFLLIVFGFGMVTTKDYLERVNETRKGNHYMDEDAANAINRGSIDKPKLIKSSFVATFKYSASDEGY